jgi:hypothetical protein
MVAHRKWVNRSRFTQLRLPSDYLQLAKGFLALVDANDPEALEIIQRRSLDKPKEIHHV